MEELDLDLPEVRLRALARGPADGPLALCVPGLSANATAFGLIGDALEQRGVRVVALDLRGRGRSDVPPPGSYGLRRHVADILAAADALGAGQFHLVGWSMGALVGLLLAGEAPDRLRSLTLIDHAGRMDGSAVAAVRAGLARLDAVVPSPEAYVDAIRERTPIRHWDERWSAFYRYELAPREDGAFVPRTDARACREDMDDTLERDWAATWRSVRAPTLLLRCAEPLNGGFIVPADEARAFAGTVPGARTVEVPANHFDVMGDGTAAAAIADFIAPRG